MNTSGKATPIQVSSVEIEETLQYLSSGAYRSESYDAIRNRIRTLVNCGFMTVVIPAGKIIYRGRLWDPQSQSTYKNVSEISYPPAVEAELGRSLNRASSNQFQIFYGAVGTPDFNAPEIISITEISRITDETFPEYTYEYVAMGQWTVVKEFTVAALALHSDIAKHNRQAQEMLTAHESMCSNLGERGALIDTVSRLMSHEFSKKVHGKAEEYLISSIYGDLLFEMNIPGIIFPSVSGDGKTFNVALNGKTVDNHMKILVAGVTQSYKKNITHINIGWALQCETIVDGKFQWKEPGISEQIRMT